MTTVFVAGTGTDVGKTWVTVRLIAELRARGHAVYARKPAQSFAPDERGTTDAELLATATEEPATSVCPAHRWYDTPMAPPMAATVLRRPAFTVGDLAAELTSPADGVTFVEGAGGPRSPIADDGDNVTLARAIGARFVILVAESGLGTINAVELSVGALSGFETIVMLNRFTGTELHERNRVWLASAGHTIVTSVDELALRVEARIPA